MDITAVSIQWLEAREAFHESGRTCLHAYCDADEKLLAAFSADWHADDPDLFAYAYQSYRLHLIQSEDR